MRCENTLLIIHGITGYAGIHWQKWLHDQALEMGLIVLMPEMPQADHPDRFKWLEVIKELLKNVDLSKLIIVGHSLGVTTALDFLEQEKRSVKCLISVSGFAQNYDAELNSYFLKVKNIDFEKVKKNLQKAYVLYGDNDPYVPQDILRSVSENLNVKPMVFKKGGHLNTKSGYTMFSELLEIVKKN